MADDQKEQNPLAAFTDEQLQALTAAGFDSLEKLDAATDDELRAIPGVGAGTVKSFRAGQEKRGVTPPSNDPPVEGTVVHQPPPISDTVSHVPAVVPEPLDSDDAPEKCPECGSPLIPYMGDNMHKLGSAECLRGHGRFRAPARVTV